MAITNNNITYWDPLTKPQVGSICMDNYTLQVKVFDGTAWIPFVTIEAMEDINLADLQRMIRDRKNMSDSWIEINYPDLKELRKRYEKEYNTLRDKYKVFEILKISGDDDNVR